MIHGSPLPLSCGRPGPLQSQVGLVPGASLRIGRHAQERTKAAVPAPENGSSVPATPEPMPQPRLPLDGIEKFPQSHFASRPADDAGGLGFGIGQPDPDREALTPVSFGVVL